MSLTSRVTDARLKARYRAEARFKGYCITALLLAMTFLVVFFFDIIRQGYPAFYRAEIQTQITYSERSVEIPTLAVLRRRPGSDGYRAATAPGQLTEIGSSAAATN